MKSRLAIGVVVLAAVTALLAGCYVVATPDGMAIGIAPLITVAAPRMAYIAGTPIQVVSAHGVSGDVFYYSGVYWRCYNGIWYRRSAWSGGWLTVRTVPRVFLSIPRTHRSHRAVRYHPLYKKPVKVHRSTPAVKTPVRRSTKKAGVRVVVPPKKKKVDKEADKKPDKKKKKKKGYRRVH